MVEKEESEVREGKGNGKKAKAGRKKKTKKRKKTHHRVQQPVLRFDLAVDASGHRPQGPDALAQGVDAPVVVALEGLGVDLLGKKRGFLEFFFFSRSGLRKEGKKESNAIAESLRCCLLPF